MNALQLCAIIGLGIFGMCGIALAIGSAKPDVKSAISISVKTTIELKRWLYVREMNRPRD